MDKKKIWRWIVDVLTLVGAVGLAADLARLWSWLVEIWEFLDARLWLRLSIFVLLSGVGQWLRWKIKREEVERKAREAKEAVRLQQAEEEAAKMSAKQKARERVWSAADEILIILKQLWDSWDDTSDETWQSFESLIRDMRDAALELPAQEASGWHNYALELYLICKSGTGCFADIDAAERRRQLRMHSSHLSGIIANQLVMRRRRLAPP